jgi:hypothetical protein
MMMKLDLPAGNGNSIHSVFDILTKALPKPMWLIAIESNHIYRFVAIAANPEKAAQYGTTKIYNGSMELKTAPGEGCSLLITTPIN